MEDDESVTEHCVELRVVKFSRICFHGKDEGERVIHTHILNPSLGLIFLLILNFS